jgi:hypothetical protein
MSVALDRGRFDPLMKIDLFLKDIRLMLEAGQEPCAALTDDAATHPRPWPGTGQEDLSGIIRLWRGDGGFGPRGASVTTQSTGVGGAMAEPVQWRPLGSGGGAMRLRMLFERHEFLPGDAPPAPRAGPLLKVRMPPGRQL